ALDYYRRASCQSLVPLIQVPTLILTARDDPFIAVEPFEELRAEVPAHVAIRVLSHGGHLGFLGWDGAGGIRWADRPIADWIPQPADRGSPAVFAGEPPAPRALGGSHLHRLPAAAGEAQQEEDAAHDQVGEHGQPGP